MPIRNRDQFFKRGELSIPTVETFNHDPDPAHSTIGPPLANCTFDRLRIVMGAYPKVGPPSSRTFLNTCMHERIENQQIAPLRQRCQDSEIRHMTAVEKNCCLCAEELGSFFFEFRAPRNCRAEVASGPLQSLCQTEEQLRQRFSSAERPQVPDNRSIRSPLPHVA